jgi:formylglycine-generating enzyme
MLKIHHLALLSALVLLAACKGGSYNGQLMGVQDRPSWHTSIPYGMVYCPSGVLNIGQSDEDINNSLVQENKTISLQGFFMDQTEITNNQYRQFVFWVRDSIIRTRLGDKYLVNAGQPDQHINWNLKINYKDPEVQQTLDDLYYPENQRIMGKKEMDPRNLTFAYDWVDYKEAARDTNRMNPDFDRSTIIHHEVVNVYPDTLCWIHDFTYSYNDEMTRNYFWHPAFDNYPVVGVTWLQANAFSAWRTKYLNDYRSAHNLVGMPDYRLPTEAEWEYAARGGRVSAPYPWGGPYMRNKKGCILANFKPGRGDYADDGGFYTVKADAYYPNDFGLYNMSGNVSEWTITAFYEEGYTFENEINPDIRYDAKDDDPVTMKRKVIRGGSWKDIAYFCQTGTRDWEYQDSAKSFVGFRDVMDYLGRSIKDKH